MSYEEINREFVEMSDDLGMLDKTPQRDNIVKASKDIADVKAAGKARTGNRKGKVDGKLAKLLKAPVTNRQVIKDNSIRINVNRLAQSSDIDAQNDRSRFFNNNFRLERRQLFFGN